MRLINFSFILKFFKKKKKSKTKKILIDKQKKTKRNQDNECFNNCSSLCFEDSNLSDTIILHQSGLTSCQKKFHAKKKNDILSKKKSQCKRSNHAKNTHP